jgi:hypothetical protein
LWCKGVWAGIEKKPLKLGVSPYKIRVFWKICLTYLASLGIIAKSSFSQGVESKTTTLGSTKGINKKESVR